MYECPYGAESYHIAAQLGVNTGMVKDEMLLIKKAIEKSLKKNGAITPPDSRIVKVDVKERLLMICDALEKTDHNYLDISIEDAIIINYNVIGLRKDLRELIMCGAVFNIYKCADRIVHLISHSGDDTNIIKWAKEKYDSYDPWRYKISSDIRKAKKRESKNES